MSEARRRHLTFGDQPLTTAVMVDRPYTPVAGTRSLTNAEAIRDGLRPVDNAVKTIALVRTLLWIVAGLVVGSVIYLGVLERSTELAVLKGMGARTPALLGSLAVEAAVLALAAAALGTALALALAPAFPLSAEIPARAYALLPVLAVAVALLGSIGAGRRLVSVQPALSFGSRP